ncbi:MAG TPA: DNA polymerase domain-containing protein [Candidatus Thermoplasmatota archaeon]|nr:DNA polymerase domain-containing protein [Candidatus Thermoplasmatota archaeon]
MQDTWRIATDLRKLTKTKGFLFFDVDHSQESRWTHSQGLWSLCRLHVGADGPELRLAAGEDRWTHHYPDPALVVAHLEVQARQLGHQRAFTDPLEAIRLGDEVLSCLRPGDPDAERDVLRELGRKLHALDPDVLTTHGGDQFDVPYLLHRIDALGLRERVWLGRDPDPRPERPDQAAKSIHTYGRWLFKSHAYYLRGRWHLDLSKKSLDSEEAREDVQGILYLARVSNRRAQDVNRNGAGFALQQMQVDHAVDLGVALPWKRNLTEDWKDAATLHAVDRGSQIMVPTPGVYGDVVACDFSGYYPGLVVAHNLSSDSLNCQCCPDGPLIPELDYHICQRHKLDPPEYGHQAEILRRLQGQRRWAKSLLRQAKSGVAVDPDLLARARAIKSEHKAIGVVCFGYFRYRNARFGCAEVHQAIQCLGRESMTKARTMAQAEGYRMVHELTDCAFLQRKGVTREEAVQFAGRVTRALSVPLEVEGVYKWLVLLPSKLHSTTSPVGVPNRYYGKFEDGKLKVRGIEVQRHSTPKFLHGVQERMLGVLAEAEDPAGFRAQIPLALRVAKQAARQLIAREVEPGTLALTIQATRAVEEYAADTGAKAALLQLRDAGTERRPGEFVQYVITRAEGPWAGRTKPVALLEQESRWFGPTAGTYHVDAYLRLLARQVETILAPFGYTEDSVYAWLWGRSRRPEVEPLSKPAPPPYARTAAARTPARTGIPGRPGTLARRARTESPGSP